MSFLAGLITGAVGVVVLAVGALVASFIYLFYKCAWDLLG